MENIIGSLGERVLGKERVKKIEEKIAMARAIKACKRYGIKVPEDGFEIIRTGVFDNGDNPEVWMSNCLYGTKWARESAVVSVTHSSERKDRFGVTGEMTRVSRSGLTSKGDIFSFSLTMVEGSDPEVRLTIDHPERANAFRESMFVLSGNDDMAEMVDKFPEFADFLSESGKIDVKATMAALSDTNDLAEMPIVMMREK